MENEYKDIINLSRPKSKRKKMPMKKRAAQFGAFNALTNYDAQIKEVAEKQNKLVK